MKPRLIGLLIILAVSLLMAPLAAEAQPAGKVDRIGMLHAGSPDPERLRHLEAFGQRLRDRGWVEGQNLAMEVRYAEGQRDRLPDLAAELVGLTVEVVMVPNARTAERVQQVTRTVPIVVTSGGDLVTAGLVASLAKPGGHVTGLQTFQPDLAAKRLELLQQAVPQLSRVGFLFEGPPGERRVPAATLREAETAARALGVELRVLVIRDSPEEFPQAFAALTPAQSSAVMVDATPFMTMHRAQIAALALEHRLPTIFEYRGYVEVGGLMSYGVSAIDLWRRAAGYVDKILKGAHPGDLPVEQPTKFELVINLKTVQALGLIVSPTLLFQADEVIRSVRQDGRLTRGLMGLPHSVRVQHRLCHQK